MPNALTLPFFEAVNEAGTILLAGMGGGYDIYSGLPLYFALRGLGKTVHLANLSFSALYGSTGERLGEALVKVTHRTEGSQRYFPERHLARWFHEKRHDGIVQGSASRDRSLPRRDPGHGQALGLTADVVTRRLQITS